MSSALAFSETNKNRLPQWVGQFRSGLFAALVGGALVYMAVGYFIPADTLSTALFFDGLNLRHAVEGTTSAFSPWNSTQVSNEGFYFSVFISLANIALAYLTVFSGDWITDKQGGTIIEAAEVLWRGGWRRINTTKAGYFSALILITIFETVTGGTFRATTGGVASWMTGLAYAMVVENLASDFALTAGVGMLLGGLLQVYDAVTTQEARNDISRLTRGKPAPEQNKSAHPAPRPQAAQPKPPHLPEPARTPRGGAQGPQPSARDLGKRSVPGVHPQGARPQNGHPPPPPEPGSIDEIEAMEFMGMFSMDNEG